MCENQKFAEIKNGKKKLNLSYSKMQNSITQIKKEEETAQFPYMCMKTFLLLCINAKATKKEYMEHSLTFRRKHT